MRTQLHRTVLQELSEEIPDRSFGRRGAEDQHHPGRHRRVVQRTTSWVLGCERLGLRYDRPAATLLRLLLPVTLVNLRRPHRTTQL